MKEREKKRAKKPDQAAAKGKPSGGGDSILGTVTHHWVGFIWFPWFRLLFIEYSWDGCVKQGFSGDFGALIWWFWFTKGLSNK